MIKYFWLSIQIFYLKQKIKIYDTIERINENRLRRYVNLQILASSGNDIEVLKTLYNIK